MAKVQVDFAAVSGEAKGKGHFVSKVFADRVELLRARSEVLGGKDRALMQMYLERGGTFNQIARLMGVSEATVARRIRKLTRRLLNGEYIICLRNSNKFNSLEQSIAKDYFVEGLGQKQIAIRRDTTVYQVRKCLSKIRVMTGLLSDKSCNVTLQ